MNYLGILEKRHFSVFSTRHIHNNGVFPMKYPINENLDNHRHSTKVRLRTNSIFAFNNDDKYSNFEVGEKKETTSQSEESKKQEASNFFSNNGESWSNLAFNRKESVSSDVSVSSGIEKNFDFIESETDKSLNELNKAKIEFTLDQSRNSPNSNSSQSELSEHYDEVDDFSPQSRAFGAPRLSIYENFNSNLASSQIKSLVQTKLNKLTDKDSNQSLSLDITGSNSPSPNVPSPKIKKNLNCKFTHNNPSLYNLKNINEFNNGNISWNSNSSIISPIKRYKNDYAVFETINSHILNPVNKANSNCGSNSNKTNNNLNNNNFNFNGFQASLINNNSDSFNQTMRGPISNNFSPNQEPSKRLSFNSFHPKNYSSLSTCNQTNNFIKQSSKGSHQELSSSFSQIEGSKSKNKHSKNKNLLYANFLKPEVMQDDNYVLENTCALLSDQNGCRMMQKKIEEKTKDKDFLSRLYFSIENNIISYINDQFGNYVIQKYFECIYKDAYAVTKFFEKIQSHLIIICLNTYGTRFFQRALEFITPVYPKIESEKLNIIFKDLLMKHTLDLILDTNGNHVFQKILVLYPKKGNDFIYDELIKSAFSIAKLKQGGCIFQRALDLATPLQRIELVTEILKYLPLLINDEYGNFIIQQIVLLKDAQFNQIILHFLKTNFTYLAKKKFSSNVIDKCILVDDTLNNFKLRKHIIDFVIENHLAADLICDQYGNYVIQKALQVSDGLQFMAIIHEIKSAVKILKQTSYGRKIYENLIMQYGDYFNNNKIYNGNNERRKSHMNSFVIFQNIEKD